MAEYDIDFVSIIRCEIHKRDFYELTSLHFSCLVQQLCDKTGVPELPGVDLRVEATSVAQMSLIKDPANTILVQRTRRPSTVILA